MSKLAAATRKLTVPALMAVGFALSACTIQPLYSAAPQGVPLQQELAAVTILPVTDRTAQIVRNELLFAFTGGGAAAAPRYELSISTSTGGGGLNITAPGNVASTVVAVTVRYSLVEIATGRVIENGSATAETRFQTSNQAFSNVRARTDAEERAATAAADQVRIRISAALATYVSTPMPVAVAPTPAP